MNNQTALEYGDLHINEPASPTAPRSKKRSSRANLEMIRKKLSLINMSGASPRGVENTGNEKKTEERKKPGIVFKKRGEGKRGDDKVEQGIVKADEGMDRDDDTFKEEDLDSVITFIESARRSSVDGDIKEKEIEKRADVAEGPSTWKQKMKRCIRKLRLSKKTSAAQK